MGSKKTQRSQKGVPRNRNTVDARIKNPGSGRNWRKGKHTSTTTTVRSDQMRLMHGQLASLSTAADDWNHTEVGEESEMDSRLDFQECRTSLTKPRWLDERTEIPREEYNNYYYQIQLWAANELWAANKEQDALLKEMDITLYHLHNCAAMHTVYDLLSTAWKMRLQKNAERRNITLRRFDSS